MEQTISVRQASIEFGINHGTIEQWVAQKKIKAVKVDGLNHVRLSDIRKRNEKYNPTWRGRREQIISDLRAFGMEQTVNCERMTKITGISSATVARWIKSGKLYAEKIAYISDTKTAEYQRAYRDKLSRKMRKAIKDKEKFNITYQIKVSDMVEVLQRAGLYSMINGARN